MILYDYILSPSCYKVRLMAALCGIPLSRRPIDAYPGFEHKSPDFLAINPAGTLPVLLDGELILTESTAILVYLAQQPSPDWLGHGSARQSACTQQWLSFAQRLTASLGGARAHDMLQAGGDIESLQADGVTALRELEAGLAEQRIAGEPFLVGERPTIADIACFPFVALAPDGGVTLDPYPSIRLWMRALRALPGFIEMPGIYRRHDLLPEPEQRTD